MCHRTSAHHSPFLLKEQAKSVTALTVLCTPSARLKADMAFVKAMSAWKQASTAILLR